MYLYRLRHSYGSHQKENGRKLESIQLSMRHNGIGTTLGYVKVAKPEEIEQVYNHIIMELLGGEK